MKTVRRIISPTLLCADQLNLEEQIQILEKLPIPWHHIDIMDGHYVPNLAFGIDTITAIRKVTKEPILVHLMADNPSEYIDVLANIGIDYFMFHFETTKFPYRLCKSITDAGMQPCLAINPITSIENSFDLLDLLSVVNIMAVEPGYSGQKFIDKTIDRIMNMRKYIISNKLDTIIEVDGGIDMSNGPQCLKAGADILVGGAFTLFREGKSVSENFRDFEACLRL